MPPIAAVFLVSPVTTLALGALVVMAAVPIGVLTVLTGVAVLGFFVVMVSTTGRLLVVRAVVIVGPGRFGGRFELPVLNSRRAELGASGLQRGLDIVGLVRVHAGAGRGHVLPEPVRRRPQARAVQADDKQQVSLGRGAGQRPVPQPRQALCLNPCSRASWQSGQQHAGPHGRGTQGETGQVHRRAPSRQA
ncbi:hypothetical protein [Streptomyces sp. NPDC048341]|uniref:hypothetical protein n=1 Tax=Streptomyces sp. NPDC048341 TaxID=3154620 RepID=UPI00343CF82F